MLFTFSMDRQWYCSTQFLLLCKTCDYKFWANFIVGVTFVGHPVKAVKGRISNLACSVVGDLTKNINGGKQRSTMMLEEYLSRPPIRGMQVSH